MEMRSSITRAENRLRSQEENLSQLCRRFQKAAKSTGNAGKAKQQYMSSVPKEFITRMNIVTIIFLLLCGYIITACIYYTDLLLLNDAAQYFSNRDRQEFAMYAIPFFVLSAEIALIMLSVKLSEIYSQTGFKPALYDVANVVKFIPILIVLISVYVKYEISPDKDNAYLLQYIAFGLLLIGLHLVAILCGRYVVLGIILPLHWLRLAMHNVMSWFENHRVEQLQNNIRTNAIKYKDAYNNYLKARSQTRESSQNYIFNNTP